MKNAPYRTYRGKQSLTNAIYETIRKNPGITNPELYEIFRGRWSKQSIKRAIENLRDNRQQIVNRGGSRPARWYVVDSSEMSVPIGQYYALADEILETMRGMTFGEKRGYLADRLAEIGEKKP